MTLKKTCACGKCNQESDSVGNFKNQKTDQEKIIDKTREQAKQEERERIRKGLINKSSEKANLLTLNDIEEIIDETKTGDRK